MESIGSWRILFGVAVIIVAFAVRGGAGFGGGAVAVPLLSLVFPVQLTVPVVTVLNMLSSIGHGVVDWRKIAWKQILHVMPGSLLGVFMGIYLLSLIDPQPLARALGGFVILYAAYVLVFADRPPVIPRRWLLVAAGVTSTAAGIIGALFGGAAGPVYVIYLNTAQLGKDVFRVTITTIMLFQGLSRVAGYAVLGLYDARVLALLGFAVPVMVLGSWLGARVVRRLDQGLFNRAIAVVLLVSGAALLLR